MVFATFPEVFPSMTKFDFRNRCNGRNKCHVIKVEISKISRVSLPRTVFDEESPGDLHFCSNLNQPALGRNLTYAWPRLPFGILVDRTLYAARHTRILDPGTSRVRELYAARPPVYLTVSDLQMNLRCLRCSALAAHNR